MTTASTMSLAVHLASAVVLYERFPALAGADLDVESGEVMHLSGPNGAGKTTLLRACAGLAAVSSGQAEVLGHDLRKNRRAVRRRVGLLGHETHLYDDLSVEDNVRFAVRAAAADMSRVPDALARMGLDGRLRTTATERLSAGQRRRVALAVLVARDPSLWLLDEPHASLDAPTRDVVDEIVRDVAGRGATVIIASHELERAGALADRQATVVGGEVHATQPYAPRVVEVVGAG